MSKIIAVKERFIFSKAYNKGKKIPGKFFSLYFLPNYRSKDTMLGITVSKKLGGAVLRTRVRRLAREAFRYVSDKYSFPKPYYVIAVARSSAFDKKVKAGDVSADFEKMLLKSGIFRSENAN